jgi:hypothetical protein
MLPVGCLPLRGSERVTHIGGAENNRMVER